MEYIKHMEANNDNNCDLIINNSKVDCNTNIEENSNISYRQLINYGITILERESIENAKADARILLIYVCKIDSMYLLMHMESMVPQKYYNEYISIINIRKTHFPLQYITKEQNFMGFDFFVDEGVLIPRQDTEHLVEQSLNASSKSNSVRVLDICSGSGCVGISYALIRKEQGYIDDVTLADISERAIEISSFNNDRFKAGCKVILSNLFQNIEDKYNIIISNPPYIRSSIIEGLMPEVKAFEPLLALDGYEDGLYFYKKISKEARRHLNEDGKLLYEIGYDQFEDVRKILVSEGYSNIVLYKDYAGLDRVIQADY